MLSVVFAQLGTSETPATLSDFETVFANILSIAIGLAAVALFIMLMAGGFQFITAGGDPKKAAGARNTLTWAVAGMVFVALSYFILRIIAVYTGVTGVLNFTIYRAP